MGTGSELENNMIISIYVENMETSLSEVKYFLYAKHDLKFWLTGLVD